MANKDNNIIPFYQPTDKLIVKSKDCYLYDSEGKEYIDFESGVWCTNVGHNNERLAKLVVKQAGELIHHGYSFRNEYAEKLSQELQRLTGLENGSGVFLSSGSEAVNLSITLAKHLTGRNKILKVDNSYLSAFGPGQLSPDNDSKVNISFNDIDSISKINFNDISAFVIETGGASVDMVRFPDKEFLEKLTDVARKKACLIIADEVTTGFGRLGKWFGYQYYDIVPDMVVTGKALGNGFPVSGLIINEELAEKFRRNSFRYAQSHQNDPFGCAVGLEVIKIIEEENLIEKCNLTGDYFSDQLESLAEKYKSKVKEVRARGLMLALEFENIVDGMVISRALFEAGFVAGSKNNTLRFLPPLTIQNGDIDKLILMLDELLVDV